MSGRLNAHPVEVGTLAFEIRYCSTNYGVFEFSRRVCANLLPCTYYDFIRVLFVCCHAAASTAQDSREINFCFYAHFNYQMTIVQCVKFSLCERCLARSVVLEYKGLRGPGLCCKHCAGCFGYSD